MKKQGPCFHCGTERTPLWRNGPPEKPVLCNACGSRFRLGEPLENYAPKTIQIIRNKKQRPNPKPVLADEQNINIPSNGYHLLSEEYERSESSSTSLHYKPLHADQEDRSDEKFHAVEKMGSFWGASVPSRKRTRVAYNIFKPFSVKNIFKPMQRFLIDLHFVLREEMRFCDESQRPDDVLIHHPDINNLLVPSNEIGLGSMLLKLPLTNSQRQENHIYPMASPLNDAPYDKK